MAINLTLCNFKSVQQLADAFLKGEAKKRHKSREEDVFADGRNEDDSTVNMFLNAALALLERESFDYEDLIQFLKVAGIEDFNQIEKLWQRWTSFLIEEGKVKQQEIIINNFPLFIKLF